MLVTTRDTVWPLPRAYSTFGSNHREDGALRVEAMGDPATAGDLHGAMDDLAAGVLHPCHSALDGIDIEIIKPERRRCLRHLGHHAAAWRAACRENLIDAHWSHIHGFGFGPAKQAGIEGEGARPVARMQFLPADMAWRPWRGRCC